MSIVLVTGSGGLIGSEASRHFAGLGHDVVGIDNDMRSYFFGAEASTSWNVETLQRDLGRRYRHRTLDIRDRAGVDALVRELAPHLAAIVHTAAQPSHDWAAKEPFTDFDVNAGGTLNLLEAARQYAPAVPFVFMSTNKVYGDTPNRLPLVELERRYELPPDHKYHDGITEDMSIDASLHSLFGASKVAADVLVQEYGRYFGMPTACFRGGTLTGPAHSATQLHGFLAYLMRCAIAGRPYTVFGYKGKQVRDAIHAHDLVAAIDAFVQSPRPAAVYNIGGGRKSHCSVLEAIEAVQEVSGKRLDWSYVDANRTGDHIWWVSSNSAFERDYPQWQMQYGIDEILRETYEANAQRWAEG